MNRWRASASAAAVAAVGAACAAGGIETALAATIVPTTTNDEHGGVMASCSLREAIVAANTDADFGGCVAPDPPYGADVIELPSGGVYVRSLADLGPEEDLAATGDLDVTDALTIEMAAGATTGAVIQGDGTVAGGRVLDVVHSAGSLGLSGVTIRGGAGGIRVAATAALTMRSATVSGNAGTGIVTSGATTLDNVTVSGNTSHEPAGHGGIRVPPGGAADLGNVTVTANRGKAAGGIFAGLGSAVTLDNTILSGNFDTEGASAPECKGPIGSNGHNLVKTTAGCDYPEGIDAVAGDITGESARLGPLASNGGVNQTHGLFPDSPALNAGNPATPDGAGASCEPDDQRGRARPVGPACDIGSFEGRVPFPPRPGVKCAGLRATMTGTRRGEHIRGTPKRDVIAALGGHDVIRGLAGNDVICGGQGRDRILGHRGFDVIRGQAGHDRLFGGGGVDHIHGAGGRDLIGGGPGPDRLTGGRGFDRLFGGRGIDRLHGGPAADRLRGGPGRDILRGGPGRDDVSQ